MKIKTILRKGYEQEWPLIKSNIVNELSDMGIEFVDSNPDVILVHQVSLNDKLLNGDIPLIVLERLDSAFLWSKRIIHQDNVIGVMKNTAFRSTNTNYDKCQRGRHHTRLIARAFGVEGNYDLKAPILPANKEDLKKIELGFTFGMYARMRGFMRRDINFNNKRSIDAFFHGCTKYGKHVDLINRHRATCVHTLKGLSGKYNINAGCTVKYHGVKYIEQLEGSKCIVSPWGLGEACYRDFEAIFAGAILIKPNSDHIAGAQDIYNKKYYIPCKADFSDLDEKIKYVRVNWKKLEPMRVESRKMLIDWWGPNRLSKHLYDIFTSCQKRI